MKAPLAWVNAALSRLGLELARSSELTRLRAQVQSIDEPSASTTALPPGAEDYLRHDNPRLTDLRARYSAVTHAAAAHSEWSSAYVASEVNLRHFRGDTAYVWQLRDRNTREKHIITAQHLDRTDSLGLLRTLTEDSAFGAYTYDYADGLIVSRDLLDSIAEAWFLERHLAIAARSELSVLDIGAGYGRLAHRLVAAFPGIREYLCVDAVAESTFISEYYLRFRNVGPRARVIALDEIDAALAGRRVDLALNIHSFSECSLAAIEWWLDLLQRHRVEYFMLVPNAGVHEGRRLLSYERDGSNRDITPSIVARGYRQVAMEPKFLDPVVQRHGISPTHHYLFRLG